MKPARYLLPALLTSLAAVALAQSGSPASGTPASGSSPAVAQPTWAERSFDTLKSLAGDWEGRVTVVPEQFQMSGDAALYHVSLRVTSRGHALVHELQQAGTPVDPSKYDHPVTMLYLDGDQLTLVHYCDAGNRPRMIGTASPDGKTVEFDLVDLSGGTAHGHMHHAAFHYVDSDHHTEDWTYMLPDGTPAHAHFDLHRMNPAPPTSW